MHETHVRAFANKESSMGFMEQLHHEDQAQGTPRMGHHSLKEAGRGYRAGRSRVCSHGEGRAVQALSSSTCQEVALHAIPLLFLLTFHRLSHPL